MAATSSRTRPDSGDAPHLAAHPPHEVHSVRRRSAMVMGPSSPTTSELVAVSVGFRRLLQRVRLSAGEEEAGLVVQAGLAQLGHGALLDLADALPGELEVLGHVVEGAGLAPVEAVAE